MSVHDEDLFGAGGRSSLHVFGPVRYDVRPPSSTTRPTRRDRFVPLCRCCGRLVRFRVEPVRKTHSAVPARIRTRTTPSDGVRTSPTTGH